MNEGCRATAGGRPSLGVGYRTATVANIKGQHAVFLDTQFYPLAVGATTISITQPAGFLPPAGRTSIVATVEPG